MITTTFDQEFNLDPYIEETLGHVPAHVIDPHSNSEVDRKVRIFLETSEEYRAEYLEEYRDGKIYLHPRWVEN